MSKKESTMAIVDTKGHVCRPGLAASFQDRLLGEGKRWANKLNGNKLRGKIARSDVYRCTVCGREVNK